MNWYCYNWLFKPFWPFLSWLARLHRYNWEICCARNYFENRELTILIYYNRMHARIASFICFSKSSSISSINSGDIYLSNGNSEITHFFTRKSSISRELAGADLVAAVTFSAPRAPWCKKIQRLSKYRNQHIYLWNVFGLFKAIVLDNLKKCHLTASSTCRKL